MTTALRALGMACVLTTLTFVGFGCKQEARPGGGAPSTRPATQPGGGGAVHEKLSLAGPFRHANLTVFVFRGPDRIASTNFLTLAEAMEKKTLVVHETGNVGELTVENLGDQDVFIQGGEILRGGRQDRMLPYDCLVKAKSPPQPLQSYCVESGRWSGRAGESVANFSRSDNMANGALLIAGMVENNQGNVWSEVSKAQEKLGSSAGKSVADPRSQTSMELTFDDAKLRQMAAEYEKALADAAKSSPDVIGCAVAVNGEIVSADIYGSNALFAKLWPKLLKNAVFAALAEKKEGQQAAVVTADDVRGFMKRIDEQAKAAKTVAGQAGKLEVRNADDAAVYFFLLQGADRKEPAAPAHTGYIKR